MKKVLSLLLVCVMLLPCALVVYADGESYTITAGTVVAEKSGKKYAMVYNENPAEYTATNTYTADWNDIAFVSENVALSVVANSAASAGYIAIDYDETKVTPVTLVNDDEEVYREEDSDYDWVVEVDGAYVDTNVATVISDGNLVVTWTNVVEAGSQLFYVTFLCNEGVTTADFDANTFKFSTDEAFLSKYELTYGGAKLNDATGAPINVTSASSFTYPGSNKTVGGDDPIVPPTEDKWGKDETATVGTVTFPTTLVDGAVTETATSGARTQIAVFGKNATAKTLADGDYWVQFNENKYLGKASTEAVTMWAIVIVDTTGKRMEAGRTYSYTAGCGDQQWTGEVTVAQIAE